MIGKRKRETQVIARAEEVSSSNAGQTQDRDIFRQYFEIQFEPLQEVSTAEDGWSGSGDKFDASSDAASLSDWNGLSDAESIPPVEIIEYGEKMESTNSGGEEQHVKAFMVGCQMDREQYVLIIRRQECETASLR